MWTFLTGCGNTVVDTETMTFEDTYQLFVENMMQDKIEQIEVTAGRETVMTESAIGLALDNTLWQATVAINTTAMVNDGVTSGLNLFDVDIVSDLLQLDWLVAISHFSDLASTYYRLNQLDVEVWGLLAGNLSYVDVMKEQLQWLIGQWYVLDGEMLLWDAAGASQLTDSLTNLPAEFYQGLNDHMIFEVKDKTPDSYKVVLSEEWFSWFLDQMSTNQYVAQVFSLPTTGGAMDNDDLLADIQQINDSVDMTLKIIDPNHVDLEVVYQSGTATNMMMTLGYKWMTLSVTEEASATTADVSWLQQSDGQYAINILLEQNWLTMMRAEGSHDIWFENDSMSTLMDIDIYVSNMLVNLPIEDEEILVNLTVDSTTNNVDDVVDFVPPSDAKEFDDFLGGMAWEYVEVVN